MPLALNELAKVHLALCELLESPIIAGGTRAQVEVLRQAIYKELEELRDANSIQATD